MSAGERDASGFPAEPELRVARFVARCRELGLKLTQQRLEIYKALVTEPGHPSAEVIYTSLLPAMPTLSLDTVYRTLVTLERNGLIGRVEVLDDHARFDANLEPHHHLVCRRCRTALDFVWPALDRLEAPKGTEGWGRVDSRHLELRGLCRRCLDQE